MNLKKYRLCKCVVTCFKSLLIAKCAFSASVGFSQNVDDQDVLSDENVYELSPFTIESEQNEGYLATSTLSGTRIKSNLNEVGSSISVMTKELLQDIGATDITDAFLYSVNTENEDEFAEDDTEGISITTTNSNRVRGIASSSYARGFFDTNIRGDSYNVERFTLSNGPNAILYGLGSPAGMVNFTTKMAHANHRSGGFSFRLDSNKSYRATMDYNLPVIENKLAVRVAALDQEKKSWKQPDVDDETRFFTTVTYKPFEKTTIRYSFERWEDRRTKSRSSLPNQSVRTWLDNDRPLWDHINERLTYDNGLNWVEAPRLEDDTLDRETLYSMGINAGGGWNYNTQIINGSDIDSSVWSSIADPDQRAFYEQYGIQGMRWAGTATSTGKVDSRDPNVSEKDGSLLPLDYSLAGNSAWADFEAETHTIIWEQRITDDLYVELAYNNESYDRDSYDVLRGQELLADVNFYLPVLMRENAASGEFLQLDAGNNDSTLDVDDNPVMIQNPNAGQFYVHGHGIGYKQEFEFDTFRATASYQLDLTEQNKWFGSHSIAVLYQKDEKEQWYHKRRHLNAPENLLTRMDHGNNNIDHRFYIDPPTVGSNGTNAPKYPDNYDVSSTPWNGVLGDYKSKYPGPFAHSMRKLEGKMVVVQNRLLQDRLITTFGFRNDKETIYQSFGYDAGPLETANFDSAYEPLPSEPNFTPVDGDTKTVGAVLVLTDWARVFYNKSDSFQPQGNLHDYWNNPLPPADGEGEDVGVMLNLMDGKVFVRASMFEQSANGALELNWTYERLKWRLVNTIEGAIENWSTVIPERPEWAAERGLSVDDVHRPEINDSLRSIRDYESEGYEVEINAKPVKGLDLRLTFAKAESKNTRTLPNLQAYIEQRLPIWNKYELLASAPQYASRIPDPSDPSLDVSLGETRGQILGNWKSIGNRIYVSNEGLSRVSFAKEEEGAASARNRKYRANFIANYRFTDGRLKGLGMGVGIRWRSKAAIGYNGKPNPVMIDLLEEEPDLQSKVDPLSFQTADVMNPIWGDELLDVDAWIKYERPLEIRGFKTDWRIQLNISNVFNDDDVFARSALTDGTINGWQAKAPRVIALTNSFSF